MVNEDKKPPTEPENSGTNSNKPENNSAGKPQGKPSKSGKPNNSGKQGKSDNNRPPKGANEYTVGWPKEYAVMATHPVETSVAKVLSLGTAKTMLRRACVAMVSLVQPTDVDDEFGDGAQNAYKVLKSLTSGARFYTETTLYAMRTQHRFLAAILARALGIYASILTKINVANAPSFGAYQLFRGIGSVVNYDTAIEKEESYRTILLEMVSEMNSLPTPTIGGLEEFFTMFSHIYRDDHGVASDYYTFEPRAVAEIGYDDATHKMTGITMTTVQGLDIPGLKVVFDRIVASMRDSVDINNLMSDMLGQFPSSRFDWGTIVAKHKDFERQLPSDLASAVGSGTMTFGWATGIGTLNTAGTRIAMQFGNLAASPAGYVTHMEEDGQLITTYNKASEDACYKLMLSVEGSGTGGAVQSTDLVSTCGMFIAFLDVLTSIGTPSTSPTWKGLSNSFTDSQSTVQSTAEQGGKELALAYMNLRALPKLDMASFGASGGSDNLFWRSEDIRRVASMDIRNNIKVLNMVNYSTVHLKTERKR